MKNSRRSLRSLSVASAGDEGWGGEDELELVNLLQLLEGLEGEDREGRRRDPHLRARRDLRLEVIAEQLVDVVDDPQVACPIAFPILQPSCSRQERPYVFVQSDDRLEEVVEELDGPALADRQ